MKDLQQITTTEERVLKLSDELLLEKLLALQDIEKEAKAEIADVKEEFKKRIKKKGDGKRLDVGERHVVLVEKIVWSNVTLGTARQLKAVKEAIDTTALGHLYKAKRKIKGIDFSYYVAVK